MSRRRIQHIDDYLDWHVDNPSWIGYGICNGILPCNSEECVWDGGDCIIGDYPGCHVYHPRGLGDGYCDGPLSNTEECGWDVGGCVCFNEEYPTWIREHPKCTVNLFLQFIGNGWCQDGLFGTQFNTKEFGWEGGDCREWNEWYPIWILDHPKCQIVFPFLIGDGRCQSTYNTEECGWQERDCLEFNEKYPDCTVESPVWIGDAWCDGGKYNTTEF